MGVVPLVRNPVFYIFLLSSFILIGFEYYLHYTERGQQQYLDVVHKQQGPTVKKIIHHVGKRAGIVDNLNTAQIKHRANEEMQRPIRRRIVPSHPTPPPPANYPHHHYMPIQHYRRYP